MGNETDRDMAHNPVPSGSLHVFRHPARVRGHDCHPSRDERREVVGLLGDADLGGELEVSFAPGVHEDVARVHDLVARSW